MAHTSSCPGLVLGLAWHQTMYRWLTGEGHELQHIRQALGLTMVPSLVTRFGRACVGTIMPGDAVGVCLRRPHDGCHWSWNACSAIELDLLAAMLQYKVLMPGIMQGPHQCNGKGKAAE